MEKDIFEVQTKFTYGWENCWSEEGNDGVERLQTFETAGDAEEAIHEFFADLQVAGMRGLYEFADYRVRKSLHSPSKEIKSTS